MKKQPFHKDIEALRKCRRQALIEHNPDSVYIANHGEPVSLGEAVNAIAQYIYVGRNIGDNPMQHFRKYFPDFEWQYYHDTRYGGPETIRAMTRIISDADYLFSLHPSLDHDWTAGFITMKLPRDIHSVSALSLCVCSDISAEGPNLKVWPDESLLDAHATLLVNDPWRILDDKPETFFLTPLVGKL